MTTASKADVRSDRSPNFWTAKATPTIFGLEAFQFTLVRGTRGLPTIVIHPEHVDWQRTDAARSGELNLRQANGGGALEIAKGDEVLCEVALNGEGAWKRVWQMTVGDTTLDAESGLITVPLKSVLDALAKGKMAWKFTKGKAKPRGWTAREVTQSVCRRLGVRIDVLPKASHRILKLTERSASGLDVIVKAWKAERTATGRRFDVDLSTGWLRITELREPRYMLELGPTIASATIAQTFKDFATTIIATGTGKRKVKGRRVKLRVVVEHPQRRRRYGYIPKTLKAPRGIDTQAELRVWARRQLASLARAKQSIDITHAGIPFVDRGDAMRVRLPTADLDLLAFVTEARHDLSAGSYTMQLTVDTTDQYADGRKERVKKAKAKAAARRKRNGTKKSTSATPSKAAVRADK